MTSRSNFTDTLIDKATVLINKKISEITDGKVSIESIRTGQIKLDANEYVDKVSSRLNEILEENKLQEIELPAQTMNVNKDVACGIVLPGQMHLIDGNLTGLSSFSRMGLYAIDDPIISARGIIGVKEASLDYGFKVNCLCLTEEGSINGKLSDIQLKLCLEVSRNFSVNLKEFDVSSTGIIAINTENLGSFEHLSESVSTNVESIVRKSVLDYLQIQIKKYLTEIISGTPISFK